VEIWAWRFAALAMLVGVAVSMSVSVSETREVLVVTLNQRAVMAPGGARAVLSRASSGSVSAVVVVIVVTGDLTLDPRTVERWHTVFARLSAAKPVAVVLHGDVSNDVLAMVAPASRIMAMETGLILPGFLGGIATPPHDAAVALAAKDWTARERENVIVVSAEEETPAPAAARAAARAAASPAASPDSAAADTAPQEAAQDRVRRALYGQWLRTALTVRPDAAAEGVAMIENGFVIGVRQGMKVGLIDAIGQSAEAIDWARAGVADGKTRIKMTSFAPAG
jgi:hypothetical protein